MPRVSVVVPFLNAARFMRESLDSVLAQTYADWELLLVDDGSTDESSAIALEYVRRLPERVRYLEHPGRENRGISASRNLGVRHARGEFVAELDADDVWLPEKLERLVPVLESHPQIGMVYGNTLFWYSWSGEAGDAERDYFPVMETTSGVADGREVLLRQLRGKSVSPCPCAVLLRKSVIEQVGGSVEEFWLMHEDLTLFAKLLLAADVIVLDGCWDRYRCYSQSAKSVTVMARETGTRDAAQRRYLHWLEHYLVDHGFADSAHRRLVRAALRRMRYPRAHRVADAAQRLLWRVKTFATG